MMIQNIIDYLEISAERLPDKTAVREEDRTITYSELRDRSRRIGTCLSKADVFGRPVGVYMDKGIDALCSFFGIVYAGGFYCMLNKELPDQRLARIRETLQAEIIITAAGSEEKAGELFGGCIICAADEMMRTGSEDEVLKNIRGRMIDTDPLYVNFTSGSTGVPKGIAVAHRSVIDFIEHFTGIFGIGQEDVIANQAPFDFDVSVKDIYSALKTGATLVIVPGSYFSAPVRLLDYLCAGKVTIMIWAVSALCLITAFHGLDYKTPGTVRMILFSGEIMPFKHLRQWQEHLPSATYVNLYGPTEITCNCTYHILSRDRDYSGGIPIGKSFPNEDVFLLDKDNKKINAPGITGMITVRGSALALGYYRLADKDQGGFVRNPLHAAYPETVYLTGDLGRYDENGDLIYCGRTDNQIKYMGHRIELEEIERSMMAIEGVDRCFCVFEKEKLKGYYVGNIGKAELHAVMKETLPVFMVPGYIRRLEKMPITKNGKIDRKAAVLSAEVNK